MLYKEPPKNWYNTNKIKQHTNTKRIKTITNTKRLIDMSTDKYDSKALLEKAGNKKWGADYKPVARFGNIHFFEWKPLFFGTKTPANLGYFINEDRRPWLTHNIDWVIPQKEYFQKSIIELVVKHYTSNPKLSSRERISEQLCKRRENK